MRGMPRIFYMSNLITDRVAYFLKDHAPFSFIPNEELQKVVGSFKVKYYQKGQLLFEQGQLNSGFAFVLRKGNVLLLQRSETESTLVDQCEPGDVFGVRSILSGNSYVMSAEAAEDSLVYLIPKEQFDELLNTYQRFALFFASGYAAGQALARTNSSNSSLSLTIPEENKLSFSKEVLTCKPETTIQKAAKLMAAKNVGSVVVVDKKDGLLGIITDRDLRVKVIAQGLDFSLSVDQIMSSPVISLPDTSTVTEVQMKMIDASVHHVILTKGTTTQLAGIVSDHDVLISQLNHPSAIIKALKHSDSPEEWKELRQKAEEMLRLFIEQDVSMELLARLIFQINDVIIQKAIDLHVEELELEGVEFAWVSLGSEGREEQMLRTDQDNAVVYSDSNISDTEKTKLHELAERVNSTLEMCGFEKCPAEIMARNSKWCQSLDQWKSYFDEWVINPDPKSVMHCTIFFDFRLVSGSKRLVEDLQQYLFGLLKSNRNFIGHLAKNATQNPPPLSFFKNLIVERSGEHEDRFDIKRRAMMPLVDAARVLALEHRLTAKNTIERYKQLIELEPNHQELMEEAHQAYGLLMKYRTREGLAKNNSGRYVEISKLNKLEKQILKNAFQPIKELQELLEVRFKLVYFN